MIIGITGGTGCGKTTLLEAIESHGGLVLDCDEIYHRLLRTDEAMLRAIDSRFPGVVDRGVLDRKKLGAVVFADEAALLDLNAITHAAVKREVVRQLSSRPTLAAIDAIGLFEGELAPLCDITVAVCAPVDDRVKRIMLRDGISEEYARKRIAAQKPDSWFRERCTLVLENSGTKADCQAKCLAFLSEIGIMEEKTPKEQYYDY